MNDENQNNLINQDQSNHSDDKKSSQNKIIRILFIIALIALFLALIINLQNRQKSYLNISPESETPQTKCRIKASNIISNNQVHIESADIVSYSFLTVNEDADGSLGNLIGKSSLYKTGFYEDIFIALDRDVKAGEVLYVQIVADDGNQIYDYPDGDQLVLNESDSPIWATITVNLADEEGGIEEAEDAIKEEEITPTESEATPTETVEEG